MRGRKRTFRRGAITYNRVAPTDTSNRFSRNEEFQHFSTHTRTLSAIKERGVNRLDSLHEFETQVISRGWGAFMTEPQPHLEPLVMEFFAIVALNPNTTVFKIRQVDVDFSPARINAFFDIPSIPVGMDYRRHYHEGIDYEEIARSNIAPYSEWEANAAGQRTCYNCKTFTPLQKMWLLFMNARLMPTSLTTTIRGDQGALLYAILTGDGVDVGQKIFDHLVSTSREPSIIPQIPTSEV